MQNFDGVTVTDADNFTGPGMGDRAGEEDNEEAEGWEMVMFHGVRISHMKRLMQEERVREKNY